MLLVKDVVSGVQEGHVDSGLLQSCRSTAKFSAVRWPWAAAKFSAVRWSWAVAKFVFDCTRVLGYYKVFLLCVGSRDATKLSAMCWFSDCCKVFCYVLVLGLLQSFLLCAGPGLLQSFLLCVGSRSAVKFSAVCLIGLLQSVLLCVGSRTATKFSVV